MRQPLELYHKAAAMWLFIILSCTSCAGMPPLNNNIICYFIDRRVTLITHARAHVRGVVYKAAHEEAILNNPRDISLSSDQLLS